MQKNTGQGEGRLRQAPRESGRRGPAPPGPTDSLNPHRLAVSLLFAEQGHLQGDGAPMPCLQTRPSRAWPGGQWAGASSLRQAVAVPFPVRARLGCGSESPSGEDFLKFTF